MAATSVAANVVLISSTSTSLAHAVPGLSSLGRIFDSHCTPAVAGHWSTFCVRAIYFSFISDWDCLQRLACCPWPSYPNVFL